LNFFFFDETLRPKFKKMKMKIIIGNKYFQCLALIGALLIMPLHKGAAQSTISLTNLGVPYTQDFNTLASSGTSTTNALSISGWAMTETGLGSRDNELYSIDNGGSNSGDTYSYGTTASTERAFGYLRSGSCIGSIGASFTNNTGSTVTSLNVAYTGEEWRLGAAGRTDQLTFEYSLDATSLTTGSWTAVSALNFITPVTLTTGAKDGNLPANRTSLSSIISSLSLSNGSTIWIRWTDVDATSSDDGLAIDDFSLTPNATAPANPTKLAITLINPSSPLAGSGFSVTVQSQDGSNAPQNVTQNTTFSLSTNGFAGSIGGTITGTINALSNSVVVSGVTLPNAGTGVTLTASVTSGDNLSPGTSSTFGVVGLATQLTFVGIPSSGYVASSLATFSVEARRADNSIDNNFNGSITVSKASGPGSLSGTTSVAAVSGVATFSTLQFDQIGTYSLSTASGTLTPNTSSSIIISPAPVTWNFTAPTAANVPANLTVSTMTIGNTYGSAPPAMISSTSPSSGYAGVSGVNNAGVPTATGTAVNTATNAYFEFSLTPDPNYVVTLNGLSFGTRSTGTGPQAFYIRSNKDNYTADIATGTIANSGVWSLKTPAVSSTSSNAGNAITFRIYGYNGSGNATLNQINWRIDDVLLNLTVSACTQPIINVNSGSIISGDSFTITPSGTALTYTFSGGSSIVSPTVTTTYTVTGTSSNGCVNSIGAVSTVTVNAAVPLTQLTPIWCNSTLTALDASVRPRCNAVANAVNYEWQFTDVSTGLVVFTRLRNAQWPDFYLTSYWPAVQYNKTYSVKVRAKVGTTWGNYGPACTITTPTAGLVPTELTTTYCNTTLSSFNSATIIRCNQVIGATNYEWQFTDVSNPSLIYTRVRNAQWTDFYLAAIPQLSANKTYSVVVRAYVNGTWGTYGNACTITIPAPSTRFALSDYEETEIGTSINVNAYPNPTIETLNVDFDNMPADASVEIYNMVGELVLFQPLTDINNTINTSQLSNGLYHAKVIGNNKLLFAQKIVKQ
jgi:hypothetical protein